MTAVLPTAPTDAQFTGNLAIADDSVGFPSRPILRPPTRAKVAARQKLAEALIERFGHDEASAAALARAVVDPAQTRNALNSPIKERVPGGTLQMVHVDVWPPAVTPSPINPRAAGDRNFPASAPADPRERPLRRPLVSAESDANGAPVLTLSVQDREHLVESLRGAMETLLSGAEKLQADLPLQGVMRPITLTAMRVTHEDPDIPDHTIATTPDGSSRTTVTWQHWGLEQATEVYATDDRKLGQRIAAVAALADKDGSVLTEAENALLRLATMPAEIVVGYTPDPGSLVSFAQAIEAWVAGIHIDPPRPWSPAADLDTKATAILGSFRERTSWNESYLDYLAGMLTPEEARNAGFRPEPDSRAVEILAVLGDDRKMTILNDGLRKLVSGLRKPRRPERLEPLVELMLRSIRGVASPGDINTMRILLTTLLDMTEWNRQGWTPSRLSLDELYEAATRELADTAAKQEDYDDPEPVGLKALELAFMAVFWLARYGGLRRQTHGDVAHDNREPYHLVREMLNTDDGLKVFRSVIEDGRSGHAPLARRPDGTTAKDATGAPIVISTAWLKSAFPPAVPAAPTNSRPTLTQAIGALRLHIEQLVSEAKGMPDEARTLGIKPSAVEEMRRHLNLVSDELGYSARIWEGRHAGQVDAAEESLD